MDLLNNSTANFEILIVLLVVVGAVIVIAQQRKKKKKAPSKEKLIGKNKHKVQDDKR
jgi:heme/copper-type cytochrome/quinol oxidase subunit 2